MDADALASFERTVALPGGERVRLRPIRPDDEPRLVELYDRLSRQTATDVRERNLDQGVVELSLTRKA